MSPPSTDDDLRDPARHDARDTPTVALEPGPAEDVALETSDGELEARLALARTRARMTGVEDPVRLGHYRIVTTLGRGGMGVVYEAVDENLGRVVAIKVLRRDRAVGSAGRSRLLREAQAAARLSHPNVAQVHEIAEADGLLYLVMERVGGRTLRRWCGAQGRDWRSILAMFLEAGRGLAAAHAVGLVHRDFKPDNVIVGDDGRPRVVDFGLARTDGAVHELRDTASNPIITSFDSDPALPITATGTVMGTPAYMAPEQYAGGLADARADQFAFCVALFEALYGRRPFPGATVTELARTMSIGGSTVLSKAERRRVPPAVHAALERGLSTAPQDRFATMDDLLAALAAGQRERRRAWPFAAVGAIAAGSALFVLAQREPNAEPDPSAAAPADPWAEIVASSDLPEPLAQPLPDDPAAVTIHRLRNGLTVYISQRPGEPRIIGEVIVRAGALDEAPGQEGSAYCMAAMLGEGTARLGSRDFAREQPQLVLQHAILEHLDEVTDESARDLMIQLADAAHRSTSDAIVGHDVVQVLDRIGPRWMSWSDELHAGYGIDMPRHRFDSWIALMGEMMRAPVFRGVPMAMSHCVTGLVWDFHTARARDLVVRELWRMRGRSFDAQRVVAGAREMRLAGAKQFHSTWYVPNNIAIVLVGDIAPAEALPVLERELGSWEPAALPESEHAGVDHEAQAPVRHQVEDAGGPLFHAAWPRPSDAPAELDALAATLAGPHGLLALLAGDVAEFSLERRLQTLWIIGRPRPDRTLVDTEAAFTAALAKIAADDVPEHVWPDALASGELARLDWAISTGALADRIALAYIEHEPWPSVAARLAAAPTRKDVVAAAKWLRERDPVIVHEAPGAPWSVSMRPLPFVVTQTATGRRSELANALVEDDRTPLEPRFLVAGSHFDERMVGEGRIVSAADDGPLFRLDWVVPVGADRDPWACDAVRTKVAAARLPGLQITALCSTAQTRITVVGAAHAWPAVWPKLGEWLASDELAPEAVRDHITSVLRDRASLRANSATRVMSQYTWFLRGEHALDAKLPADDALRTRGPREIPRALRELAAMQPDISYAGPQPQALQIAAKPAAPPRGPRASVEMRAVARPTVVLFDEPQRESVEVWVATASPARETEEQLVALAYNYLHSDESQSGTIVSSFMPHSYAPEPNYVPLIHSFVYRGVRYQDTVATIDAGIAELKLIPSEQAFERARAALDNNFRWYRVPNSEIPEHVARWLDPSRGDPRITQWQRLPTLSYAAFTAYSHALATKPPLIGVVADLSQLDRDVLASYGEIVEGDPSLIRDPGQADAIVLGVW